MIPDSPLAGDLIRSETKRSSARTKPNYGAYFAEDYVFHGPGGELGFEELRAYFASLRAAFSDLRIVLEQVIADGVFLAARHSLSGAFIGVFTYLPMGAHLNLSTSTSNGS